MFRCVVPYRGESGQCLSPLPLLGLSYILSYLQLACRLVRLPGLFQADTVRAIRLGLAILFEPFAPTAECVKALSK